MSGRKGSTVRVSDTVKVREELEKFFETAPPRVVAAYRRRLEPVEANLRTINRVTEEGGALGDLLRAISDLGEASPAQVEGRRLTVARIFKKLFGIGKGNPVMRGLWDALPKMDGGSRGSRGGRVKKPRRAVAGFAVVHSVEKPWVNEPNYKRWLAKLKRHTKKKHVEHPDNLCVDSKICKGDLGIPRKLMPQFTSKRDVDSFVSFIQKKYGIRAERSTRRAGQLRPSQEEINRERVEDVKEDIVAKKLNPNVPLIVSADGYVIDGHHRWAAYKSQEPSKKMPVLVVKDSARDVLSMAATWGAKHHQF